MSDEIGVLTRFLDELSLLLSALDERVNSLDALADEGPDVADARRDVARLASALSDLATVFEVNDVAALGQALAHAVLTPGAPSGPVALPGARDTLAYMRWRRDRIRKAGHVPSLSARERSLGDSLGAALIGSSIGPDEIEGAFRDGDESLSGLTTDEREVLRTFATAELRTRDEEVDAHQLAEAAAAMAREQAHWTADSEGWGVAERKYESRQEFIIETEEDLREFSAVLAGYGRDPELTGGQLHAVKLLAHKIKGAAPMIGLPEMAQLASYLEWTAFAYQRRADAPAETVSAVLARFLELLESALQATRAGESPDGAIVEEARHLYDSLTSGADTPLSQPGQQPDGGAPERATSSARLKPVTQPAARDALLQVDSARLDALMIHLSGLTVNRGALASAHARVSSAQTAMAAAIDRLHEKSVRIADVFPFLGVSAPLSGPITSKRFHTALSADPEIPPKRPIPARSPLDGAERDEASEADTALRALSEAVADVEMLSANLTGELVQIDQLIEGQDIAISNIQQDATRMRLAPLADLAPRLEVVANYLAFALGKRVRFSIEGEMTELDRSLMRALAEPLNQLVRNAISHGIETPEARLNAGKPEIGSVWVHAYYARTEVVIDIGDDGRGINERALVTRAISIDAIDKERARALTRDEALRLVFHPGLSALDRPGALAGSGIGLHEVETIVRALKGDISVAAASDQGTIFRIRVPVTLTVLPAMEILLGAQVYTVPFGAVTHTFTDIEAQVQRVDDGETGEAPIAGARALTRYQFTLPDATKEQWMSPERAGLEAGAVIPAFSLAERMGIFNEQAPEAAVVVERRGRYVALLVNGFGTMRETMVRPLPSHLRRRLLRGVTIRAEDGAAAMLLDLGEIADELLAGEVKAPPIVAPRPSPVKPAWRVMIVDDSVTIRRALDRTLTAAGFDTALASDGYEALELMESEAPRVIILDVEMPHLDGYETLKIIRATPRYAQTRVVMLTSRAGARHEARARELGADDYLVKPCPQDMLLSVVWRLMDDSENA